MVCFQAEIASKMNEAQELRHRFLQNSARMLFLSTPSTSRQLVCESQMLGRAYSLSGTVVHGDGVGKKLGFPTANIDATGLVLPPHGVYAVHVEIAGNHARHRGVLNIGYRPTLQNPAPQLRVEAHLLDFNGDLYDRELEITFVEKLRAEKKFPSLEALREQIAKDIADAQKKF